MRPLIFLLSASFALGQSASDETAAKDRLTMEVIKRVKDFSMDAASPKVRESVSRFLSTQRGSKEYYAFVERFKVITETENLVQFGTAKAGTVEAANAFKTLVKIGQANVIKNAILKTPAASAGAVLDTLSLSQSKEAAAVILDCMNDPQASPELKSAAVRSLGKSRNGENVLLDAARQNKLPAELKLSAGEVLHASQDGKIRQAAAELLPMPKGQGDKPLPPISKLVARKGNPASGKTVYGKICLTCHKVNDEGIDFGPALSEIGSKLPKEALYTSIIDPSAGISFGFEGFEVKTKKDDTYIGMIAGETDAELSLKVPGGVIIKTPKAEVASKNKLPISLMTPGLAGAVSEQELVDLIEYLTTLKKK